MSCGDGRIEAALTGLGYPGTDPLDLPADLGLSIRTDWGPAQVGGLCMLAALDGTTIRVYRRGIEERAAETGTDPSHLERTAIAHEVIHAIALQRGIPADEATVRRLARAWAEAHDGTGGETLGVRPAAP